MSQVHWSHNSVVLRGTTELLQCPTGWLPSQCNQAFSEDPNPKAEHLVLNQPKNTHIIPLVISLHWLPIVVTLKFKVLTLAHWKRKPSVHILSGGRLSPCPHLQAESTKSTSPGFGLMTGLCQITFLYNYT